MTFLISINIANTCTVVRLKRFHDLYFFDNLNESVAAVMKTLYSCLNMRSNMFHEKPLTSMSDARNLSKDLMFVSRLVIRPMSLIFPTVP